jgi:hypothetical protein
MAKVSSSLERFGSGSELHSLVVSHHVEVCRQNRAQMKCVTKKKCVTNKVGEATSAPKELEA